MINCAIGRSSPSRLKSRGRGETHVPQTCRYHGMRPSDHRTTLAAVPAAAEPQTASPTAAVDRPGRLKPPPGMLEALQRDLGLTKAQAQARLLNEARLTPIVAQLRRGSVTVSAAPGSRGTIAQNLVVATTSAADIPQILAAGARAEIVTRSLADLAAIKKKLDQALPAQPMVGERALRRVRTNKVVVLPGRTRGDRGPHRERRGGQAAVVVLPSTERPRPLYDLVGGDRPTTSATPAAARSVSPCSKAPRTVSSPPATAARRARPPPASTGSPRASSRPRPSRPTTTPGSPSTPTGRPPAVDNGERRHRARRRCQGGRRGRLGLPVRSPPPTGTAALIQQRDASVTYPQGNVFGLTRTNVCAEPGDSGGSFIAVDQAQGIASGGSGDCASAAPPTSSRSARSSPLTV